MNEMGYTLKQKERFVKIWNKRNGFPDGTTELPNMRMYGDEVSWNAYDAPSLDLDEVADILRQISEQNLNN